MKGKFDNIPKGTYKVSKSGHPDFNKCVVAGDGGSVCHISRWPSSEDLSAELIAFSGNLAQKYNIEFIEDVVETLKEVFEEINLADHSMDLYKKAELAIQKAVL